jgi:O-antigen ligase
MPGALRALDRRTLAVVGIGLTATLCVGLLAARSPILAVGVPLIVAVAAAMFRDLTTAVAVFTFGSFAEAVQAGGAATASKGLGALLVISWLLALARRRGGRSVPSLFAGQRGFLISGLGLLVWSALSVLWAQSRSAALLGTSRFAQDLLVLPIVYSGVWRMRHVRLVAGAFVSGALFFTAVGAVAGTAAAGAGSRLGGALGDPNDTAAALAAAAVLGFALGAGEIRSAARRRCWFVAATLAVLGLVATASRGGLVALGATAVVAVVVAGRWRRQALLAAASGAILVGVWFVLLAPASSKNHLSTLQTPRTTIWTVAGRAIAANPIVGLGNNNFTNASKNYLIQPGATTRADQIITTPEPAHNTYLEIWADLGIVGILLFAGVVLFALRAALLAAAALGAAGRHSEELLAKALLVATVAMLAAYFFISYQYSKQLWLLLALAPPVLAAARAEVTDASAGVGAPST